MCLHFKWQNLKVHGLKTEEKNIFFLACNSKFCDVFGIFAVLLNVMCKTLQGIFIIRHLRTKNGI